MSAPILAATEGARRPWTTPRLEPINLLAATMGGTILSAEESDLTRVS